MAETKPAPPRRPTKLNAKGRKLWDSVAGTYTLRPDELRVLEDACREADLVQRIETELGKGSLMSHGSMGQPVANPLIAEVRQHRATLRQLLAHLKLPDDPGGGQGEGRTAGDRSSAARKAANARWQRGA